ncbi:hypothetical protein FEE59_13515 [Herbaspirillum sp. RU 5E]|nr:hypothetical protein [Herbaspirillum sp. RU 5E]
MNNILKKLEMERGYNRRYDGFQRGLIVESELHKTGEIQPYPGGIPRDKYVLRVKVGVNFFSNQVMLDQSRRIAERTLLSYLYGDTLSLLQRAEQAVWDGDAQATLEVLAAIRKNISGETA